MRAGAIGRSDPRVTAKGLMPGLRNIFRQPGDVTTVPEMLASYRLNVFPVNVPPLRERIADVPLLAEYLVERYAKKAGKKIGSIDGGTLEMLQNYDWPGNVRELQNVIERAVILCETPILCVDETWFPRDAPSRSGKPIPFNTTLQTSEREMIERALLESEGKVGGLKGAAAKLRLPRQTLESKIKILGINKFRFRRP